MTDRYLEQEVELALRREGFAFEKDLSLGGLRPDFIVKGPAGQLVVVEVKSWPTSQGNTARAIAQAQRYREATGAERAFVVLPDLKHNHEARGVVNIPGLIKALRTHVASERPASPQPEPRPTGFVFAAMPFDRDYDDVFLVAMSFAADSIDASCERVDRSEFTGDIVEKIHSLIDASIAVIADLSDSRPNVLYEAGYARGKEKPTIHICSTDLEALPFDVRNWNTLPYTKGQTAHLREPLARRLRAVLGR